MLSSYLLLFILGLAIGSFLAAYTWRVQKGLKISSGRSVCDNCGESISWYLNIPVLSFLVLFGKSRCCNKKISIRYPLIEGATATLFALAPYFFTRCLVFSSCLLQNLPYVVSIVFLLFFISVLVAVFVIDLESLLIYDSLSFSLLVAGVIYAVMVNLDTFYTSLFAGFSSALILFLLYLLTKGRGMGLGDVKLAIPIGFFLGVPYSYVWLYLAFLTGGAVAIILILVRRAGLKERIAFGPFLVSAFFLTLFFGDKVLELFV